MNTNTVLSTLSAPHLGLRPQVGEKLLATDTRYPDGPKIPVTVLQAGHEYLVVRWTPARADGKRYYEWPQLFAYDPEKDSWLSAFANGVVRLQERPGYKVTTKALIQEQERLRKAVELLINHCDYAEVRAVADAADALVDEHFRAANAPRKT